MQLCLTPFEGCPPDGTPDPAAGPTSHGGAPRSPGEGRAAQPPLLHPSDASSRPRTPSRPTSPEEYPAAQAAHLPSLHPELSWWPHIPHRAPRSPGGAGQPISHSSTLKSVGAPASHPGPASPEEYPAAQAGQVARPPHLPLLHFEVGGRQGGKAGRQGWGQGEGIQAHHAELGPRHGAACRQGGRDGFASTMLKTLINPSVQQQHKAYQMRARAQGPEQSAGGRARCGTAHGGKQGRAALQRAARRPGRVRNRAAQLAHAPHLDPGGGCAAPVAAWGAPGCRAARGGA